MRTTTDKGSQYAGFKTMQKWWSNGVECVSANKYFVGPTVISKPDKTQDGRAFLVWKANFTWHEDVLRWDHMWSKWYSSLEEAVAPENPTTGASNRASGRHWKHLRRSKDTGDEEGRRAMKDPTRKAKESRPQKKTFKFSFPLKTWHRLFYLNFTMGCQFLKIKCLKSVSDYLIWILQKFKSIFLGKKSKKLFKTCKTIINNWKKVNW